MKFKYYIRGFGAGMIIAVIILMAAGKIHQNSRSPVQNETRDDSVIAYTKEDDTKNEPSKDVQQNPATQQTQPMTTSEPTKAPTEAPTEAPTQAPTEAPTETPTEAPTPEIETVPAPQQVGDKVRITIKNVYYATQAADLLYDAGVIDNKAEFVNYMASSGYDKKIREGVYELTPGDSYETIGRIISGGN